MMNERLAALERILNLSDLRPRVEILELLRHGRRNTLAEALEVDPQALAACPPSWWWQPRQTRWVWTGFEPFGGHEINPSAAVAEAAAAHMRAAGFEASFEELPVTFERAGRYASEWLAAHAVDDERPVWFLHMGLAANRDGVSLERLARPHSSPIPDNAGVVGPSSGFSCGGPGLLHTTIEVERLRALLAPGVKRVAGLEVGLSEDAGGYVCNAIFRASLAAIQAEQARRPFDEALFIHIPALRASRCAPLGEALAAGFIALADEVAG